VYEIGKVERRAVAWQDGAKWLIVRRTTLEWATTRKEGGVARLDQRFPGDAAARRVLGMFQRLRNVS